MDEINAFFKSIVEYTRKGKLKWVKINEKEHYSEYCSEKDEIKLTIKCLRKLSDFDHDYCIFEYEEKERRLFYFEEKQHTINFYLLYHIFLQAKSSESVDPCLKKEMKKFLNKLEKE